jgi:hypothetical protein
VGARRCTKKVSNKSIVIGMEVGGENIAVGQTGADYHFLDPPLPLNPVLLPPPPPPPPLPPPLPDQ